MTKVLSSKDPQEIINVTFDFESVLGAETVATQTVVATVSAGTDANPSAILSGAAVASGAKVLQKVAGGTAMVDYHLAARITTSGARTLVIAAILPVRNA